MIVMSDQLVDSNVKDQNFHGFWSLVKSDFKRHLCSFTALSKKNSLVTSWKEGIYIVLFKTGFHASFIYRISRWCYQKKMIFFARLFMRINISLTGADIGFSAVIGPGFFIAHPVGLVIAHKTIIGNHATIMHSALFGVKNWVFDTMDRLPQVGDNCVFCSRSTILGNVKVGNNCVIGINAVVTEDVEDNSFASGHPLKIESNKGKDMIESWYF